MMKEGFCKWISEISGLINAYFPSGTSGRRTTTSKYKWLEEFFDYINELKKKNPESYLYAAIIILRIKKSISTTLKEIKTLRAFLPEERAWMDKFFESGWIDAFRVFHPEPHRYSWWSQRFPTVRANNKGWRIDYINVTEPMHKKIKNAEIYPDIKHSDHCPVYMELNVKG